MIRQKRITIDGIEYISTYSDRKKCILQNETGVVYESAIDAIPLRYTYTETNQDIIEPEEGTK